MITIKSDFRDESKPLYIQLYESIKEDIINGFLASSTKLPSKRDLASHLTCSVKTIENAYSQLLLEGYIYSIEKKGYFVSHLDNYRNDKKKKIHFQSSYKETNFKVDFTSNKNIKETFPFTVWSRLMRETLSYNDTELLDTVPFNGTTQLRIAIARYLFEFRGMEVSPDQIIVGAGTEFLYIKLLSLLGNETVCALEDPGYSKIRGIYENSHVPYHGIPVDKDGIDVEKLSQCNANIVHVAPAHHFPLGIVMPITRRLELLSWVNKASNRYIIEDDYDCEFRYQSQPVPPIYSIDISDKVIYMNTFSKSIAPAIRACYMVLPTRLMEHYITKMNFYSSTVSSFDQLTLARFIEEHYLERHINRMRRYYITHHDTVINAIRNSHIARRTQIIENNAGTHFLLKVDTHMNDFELKKYLLENDINISCVSDCCYRKNPAYDSTLIINYADITKEQIQYFINVIKKLPQ